MKHVSKLSIFLAFLCFAIGARAVEPGDTKETAVVDPYEPEAVFQEGPHAGKSGDVSVRRSIKVLDPRDAARFSPGPGETVMANFYHEGKFWIAKLPADAVEDVIFQVWGISKFPPAQHSQLRFKMKPGKTVTLYPQVGDAQPVEQNLTDLVFSMEVIGLNGEHFNFRGGRSKHFLSAYRFKSQKEDFYERVMEGGRTVRQVKLDLSEADKQGALANAVSLSDKAGTHETYHLYCKSCTTEAYRVLDMTVRYAAMVRPFTIFRRSPNHPDLYLAWRGLAPLGRKNELAPVNDEFGHYKSDRGLKSRLLAKLKESKASRLEASRARRENKGQGFSCKAMVAAFVGKMQSR